LKNSKRSEELIVRKRKTGFKWIKKVCKKSNSKIGISKNNENSIEIVVHLA